MPDGRNEMSYVSVIRSGPTSARDEMTYASVIRNKYPEARAEMVYISVLVPIVNRLIRRSAIISDG